MVCKQSLFMSHDVHGLQRASLNHHTLHVAPDYKRHAHAIE